MQRTSPDQHFHTTGFCANEQKRERKKNRVFDSSFRTLHLVLRLSPICNGYERRVRLQFSDYSMDLLLFIVYVRIFTHTHRACTQREYQWPPQMATPIQCKKWRIQKGFADENEDWNKSSVCKFSTIITSISFTYCFRVHRVCLVASLLCQSLFCMRRA